jgi:hypothetical protein
LGVEFSDRVKTGLVSYRQPVATQFDQLLISQKLQDPIYMHGRKSKDIGQFVLRKREIDLCASATKRSPLEEASIRSDLIH